MGWGNASNVSTSNLDAGSDSPASARPDLKAALDELTAVINGRAAASGVASLDADTRLPSAQLPASVTMRPRHVVTASGGTTWTVPAGVTRILVKLWGGGGGGGYTSVGTGGDHGGGGGGGGYAEKYFDVVAGSDFTLTNGAGGTGKANSSDGDGGVGGDTTVLSPASATPASTTIYAYGGDKGYGPSTRYGGVGGFAANGDINMQGGSGASGASRGGMGGSAAGAGSPGQAGAAKDRAFGGGGFGSGSGTSAFDGMNGAIVICY